MNRKEIIIAVTALLVMVGGIVFFMKALYPGSGDKGHSSGAMRSTIVRAVPSDAVAFIVLDGTPRSAEVVADTTGLLRSFAGSAAVSFLRTAGKPRAAVSLHNSGSLVPLIAMEMLRADSLEIARAQVDAAASGLKSRFVPAEGILLASTSETLISSSVRHMEAGMSILNSGTLGSLIRGSDGCALYLSHQSTAKLLQVFGSATMRQNTSFLKSFADWTALRIEAVSGKEIVLKGSSSSPDDKSYFVNSVAPCVQGEVTVPDVLPFNTASFTALPLASCEKYIAAYREYLDARGMLGAYDRAAKARDASGITPASWIADLRPIEVAKAAVSISGKMEEVILLKVSKDMPRKVAPFYCAGYVSAVFGSRFSVPDESCCVQLKGRWSVIGSEEAVGAFSNGEILSYTLRSRFQDNSVQLPQGVVVYASLTDAPGTEQKVFSARLAREFGAWADGSAYVPVLIGTDAASLSIEADRNVLKGAAREVLMSAPLDTLVEVPKGPFKVKNSATGKINTFYQNSAMSLCLNDENGKGQWGIPFKAPLCGYVEAIDYFNNGKLQYLFAAGTKLYLIDRLGRFVAGFPVELGKEVLLGPGVYDFSGARNYNALILHKDNSIELYNLKGHRAAGWKGIKPPETVKHLPETIAVGGKTYWVVRTSLRTLVYPFNGGEPLTTEDGAKMFSPDAKLKAVDKNSVEGECLDGKTRSLKL
ncbi:MAG: hypothetical protein IKR69_07895 [Bacteroidales bacterium]|nr:hypothetical protein [Bacteroidales bacterium]